MIMRTMLGLKNQQIHYNATIMRYLMLLTLLCCVSCSDHGKAEITALLDARDTAMSNQDLAAYSSLMLESYAHEKGAGIIDQIKHMFARFEQVNMTSRDREIRIMSENSAMCEQTYVLKVFADGDWRKIIQREQLQLQRVDNEWKISAGL